MNLEHTRKLLITSFLGFAVVTLFAQDRSSSSSAGLASMSTGSSSTGFSSGAAGPIGPGDLLEMSVFDTPELGGKLRVSNTGDVILPLVGSVHVAGLKTEEAQTLIRQKLIEGNFLKDPEVTVFVAEYATQGVSVLGEVKNPGVYPALGAHTLTDYLSLAGGLTPLAGTNITVTRASGREESSGAQETVKMTAGTAPQPKNNPPILAGDSIFVERTGIVYVIGDVFRPGGFPIDHDGHLTILQAVALAQGTNSTAAKRSTKIIRTTPSGRQEIPVDLKKVLSAKATDLTLQDNDILFVPSSAARATLKTMETVVPVAAAATIYRLP
jgi:polysaccharide export outer membrane protein